MTEVSWVPPFDGHSQILKYIVEYQEGEGGVRMATLNASTTSVTITDLRPSSTYRFTVFAENAVGRSESGGVAELSLSGEVPSSPPENVEVLSLDSTTFKVSWQVGATANCGCSQKWL